MSNTGSKYDDKRTTDWVGRIEDLAWALCLDAYNEGTLDTYKENRDVVKKVEFLTAEDELVCPICGPMNGTMFEIDEAYGILPIHPWCLIDGQIPIYTDRGLVPIRKINIGDLVLTDKGRFRRVTGILRHTYNGKATRIETSFEQLKGNKKYSFSVTSEHPIFIKRENKVFWVKAEEIILGDSLFILKKRCKVCGKDIPFSQKFCSNSCNSKDITFRQWSDPEHRRIVGKKIGDWNKRRYIENPEMKYVVTKNCHTPEANRKISEKTMGRIGWSKGLTKFDHLSLMKLSITRTGKNNPIYRADPRKLSEGKIAYYKKHPEKHINYLLSKKGFKSSLEEMMEFILSVQERNFLTQYYINGKWVDFYLPDEKLIIEADGKYWHQDKEKDKIRDEEILKVLGNDWKIEHYDETQIREIHRNLNDEHKFEFMEIPVVNVKTWILKKPRMVYNLSVEDDETFLVKGIIVHNCRCAWVPVT